MAPNNAKESFPRGLWKYQHCAMGKQATNSVTKVIWCFLGRLWELKRWCDTAWQRMKHSWSKGFQCVEKSSGWPESDCLSCQPLIWQSSLSSFFNLHHLTTSLKTMRLHLGSSITHKLNALLHCCLEVLPKNQEWASLALPTLEFC